jgi:hypothetical protein
MERNTFDEEAAAKLVEEGYQVKLQTTIYF